MSTADVQLAFDPRQRSCKKSPIILSGALFDEGNNGHSLSHAEACALYGVNTTDFRHAIQAYWDSDSASALEKASAATTLLDRNLSNCWPFCAEDGSLMLLANIYIDIEAGCIDFKKTPADPLSDSSQTGVPHSFWHACFLSDGPAFTVYSAKFTNFPFAFLFLC